MTTFQQLNNYSNGTVTFTDSRPSNVIFNFPTAVNLTDQTITTQSFTLQRTIDIVEIVQPQTANVVFEVDTSVLSGVTVDFGTLPSGVTVGSLNGVFTVSGIDSVSDWESVRAPTITLPSADTAGAFEYTCKIIYTADGARVNKTWSVGTFKSVASLTATSTLTVGTIDLIKGAEAHMISVLTLEDVTFELVILARFSLNIQSTVIHQFNAALSTVSSITALPKLKYDYSIISLNIDNPSLERDNHYFGRTIKVDAGSNIVATINNNGSKSAAVFSVTGTKIQEISRHNTDVGQVVDIHIAMSQSGNWMALLERNTSTTVQTMDIHLYKRNSSTGQYAHIDNYTLPGVISSTNLSSWNASLANDQHQMTDSYLLLVDQYYDGSFIQNDWNQRVFVMSFTESGGWVKDREHNGTSITSGGNTFYQSLGQGGIATNNNNYVIAESYENLTGNYYRLGIYRHSDGALVRTINNNTRLSSLFFDPDDSDIIVATTFNNNGILKWNINTGVSVTSNITTGTYTRWERYDSTTVVVDGGQFIDETTGNLLGNGADPAFPTNSPSYKFVGTKMITADTQYDDTYNNQGRLLIREDG